MTTKVCRISPSLSEPGKPTLTRGTKVLLPSGEAIPGITKLTLIAEPNSTWKALIEIHCEVPEIDGVEYETTTLDETRARSYAVSGSGGSGGGIVQSCER